MERRVAGIIRWLERCIKAYKDGAVESALMDAECARADMENLRGDLWQKLEGQSRARIRRPNFFRAAEMLFCSLGVMLLAATPLSLPQATPPAEERAERRLSLEWVTPDEMALLSNVRKRPDESVALTRTAVLEVQPKAVQTKAVQTKTMENPVKVDAAPVPKPALARTAEPVRRGSPEILPASPILPAQPKHQSDGQKKQEAIINYENILSLIETGERAMRSEPPVIIVED